MYRRVEIQNSTEDTFTCDLSPVELRTATRAYLQREGVIPKTPDVTDWRETPVRIEVEDWFAGFIPEDEKVADSDDIEADRDDQAMRVFGAELPEVLLREVQQARAELAWLHRDPSDDEVSRRWNQPSDVLDAMEQIEDDDQRELWVERMTDFRRVQLDRLLREYLGDDYAQKQIVTRWEQKNGRWTPGEQKPVLDWINEKVEEKGSQLSGFAACAGLVRSRLARKRVAQTGESWWKTYDQT
jgi:hypothetical protein